MNQSFAPEIAAVMPAVIATGLLNSLMTVQAPDGNLGPSGAQSGVFVEVPGLSNIRCNDAVQSINNIDPTELKDLAEIMDKAPRHVTLDAVYQSLVDGWRNGWRAVVDGVVYDIIGAENDSQLTHTRVEVVLVSV